MKKRIVSMIMAVMMVACCADGIAADYAPMELAEDERSAANLFLSNFTEIGVRQLDAYGDDMALVDFAHDHMWFNENVEFEYGEYDGENNCRVSDENIQDIIDSYFYYSREVDISQTRFDYEDGYYYHCETGGWIPDGFAHVVNMCDVGDGVYFVSFYVFGGGCDWDNDVMEMTLEEIETEYGHPNGYGSALVYAEDVGDRNTYKMISFGRI